VTAGLAESKISQPADDDLSHTTGDDFKKVICELTACTPGSATCPTLGNKHGITLPLLYYNAIFSAK